VPGVIQTMSSKIIAEVDDPYGELREILLLDEEPRLPRADSRQKLNIEPMLATFRQRGSIRFGSRDPLS
jgi:hypothetical protein